MRLSKPTLLVALLSVGIVSVAIYLGFAFARRTSKQSSPEGIITQQQQLDTSGFGNREYIVPLETRADTPSGYSSRAQLRGSVLSWSTETLEVEITDDIYTIEVPPTVYLRCMPLTVAGPGGETVETSSVFLDFSNAKSKGHLVQRSDVQKKIPEGDNLTLIVNLDSKEVMTADMFVGYGCKIE